MSDATCKTCPWWNLRDYVVARDIGWCRFRAPVIHEGPPWPSTNESDWCGEHPDRYQPQIEYSEATLVTNNNGPTAADMRRIVDALEKMAIRAQRVTS